MALNHRERAVSRILYSKTHEYLREEGSDWFLGITEHAQDSLGDITFVELPEAGAEFEAGDEIATIEEVLRQIDTAPVMLRVTVRTENRHAQAGNRIGVAVMQSKESSPSPTGQATAERRLGNAVEEEKYSLRVRDGGQGFIQMGKTVPYVREMLVLAKRYAGYDQTIDFQEVNTGFWVRPVLEGDYASLDIRPHLEGFKKNAAGMAGLPAAIELQSLVTTVRVPLGKWVDLGGFLREGDEISRSIVAWRSGNSREEKTIWVKVDR